MVSVSFLSVSAGIIIIIIIIIIIVVMIISKKNIFNRVSIVNNVSKKYL